MRRPLRQEITQHATQQLLHSWPSARLAERWLVIQPHMQTVIRERKAQLNKRADFFSTPDDLFSAEICAHTTHQPCVTRIYIQYHHTQQDHARIIRSTCTRYDAYISKKRRQHTFGQTSRIAAMIKSFPTFQILNL